MKFEVEHSEWGASAGDRWRNCPGSPKAIRQAKMLGDVPWQVEDPDYTVEGTTAHNYAGDVLLNTMELVDVPFEYREHIEGYINFCNDLRDTFMDSPGFKLMVESKIPLWYRPQDPGTVDFAIYVPGKLIHFVDLKYGEGKLVRAEDNNQLIIYLLSFIYDLEKKLGKELPDEFPVHLTVWQPRHHLAEPPDTWIITIRDLKDFGIDIELDYKNSLDSNELVASDEACWFCEIKRVCKVRASTSFGGLPEAINIIDDFELVQEGAELALNEMKVEFLSQAQIDWIALHGSKLVKFINEVTEGEFKRLDAGGQSDTLKLIQGRKCPKFFKDPDKAEKYLVKKLGEAAHKKTLISATQAGKLIGEDEEFDRLTAQKTGKPKLVPITHKAPAINIKPRDLLEDEHPLL